MRPPEPNRDHAVLLLSSVRRRTYYRKAAIGIHRIPCLMLCVVAKGKGLLRADDRLCPIKPREAFLLAPGRMIEVMPETETVEYDVVPLEYVTVSKRRGSWSCSAAGSQMPVEWLALADRVHWRSSDQLTENVGLLAEAGRRGRFGCGERDGSGSRSAAAVGALRSAVQAELRQLMAAAARAKADDPEREEEGRGIERSVEYMLKHFRHKIKLETLSQIAGLTPTSYSRSFKKDKGVSPVQHLAQIRIDASKLLLRRAGCSIREAAESVGFGNEYYFSRMFKRAVGMTPTMYLKRRHLRIAVASCMRYEDNLRSLGVEPILTVNCCWNRRSCSEQDYLRNMKLQWEELRQARPDLIIGDFRHTPFLEPLKRIAPTIIADFTGDWRLNHLRIAELVGREPEAQQNLARMEAEVKHARSRLAAAFGRATVSVMRLYDGVIRVQGLSRHPLNELVYGELGLTPGSCVPLNEQYQEYAPGSVPPFDTDYLFIYKYAPVAESHEAVRQLRQIPQWDRLSVVRNERTRDIPNWIGMSWTPNGRGRIIEELLSFGSGE